MHCLGGYVRTPQKSEKYRGGGATLWKLRIPRCTRSSSSSFNWCAYSFCQTGKKRVLFDATKDGQNVSPKWVPPEEDQEANESRRCVKKAPLYLDYCP
jgi:hypothetical protein